MPIILQKFIRRSDLQANPNQYYVFGDNLERWGLGGQAKEMRGEPNAIGIATKVSPKQFASDEPQDVCRFMKSWLTDFESLDIKLELGAIVVWPQDGLGTGRAELELRAPFLFKTFTFLTNSLFRLHGNLCES